MDDLIYLALDTIQKNKQAIIFLSTRISAEKAAEDISNHTPLSLAALGEQILKAGPTPTKQCRKLAQCVQKGIAFHHAGLFSQQRELIEQEFKRGTIKIICATPTLAAGLSLPAFRVLIKGFKRFSPSQGSDWIPVLEYLQMAGRAGRPEYEPFGEAIALVKDEQEKNDIYHRYICGVPEDIYSKLAVEPVLRMYVLSLVASGIIYDNISLNEFFARTFWAHQFGDMRVLQQITAKMIGLLAEWQFLSSHSIVSEFTSAEKIGTEKIQATMLGKKVSELYLDPLTSREILNRLSQYNTKRNTFSLLQMIAHTLEMRPLLSVKSREYEKIQEELVRRSDMLLESEPVPFALEQEEFMNSFKTALFLEAWMNEHDEDYLLETYDIKPGEIRAKLEIADWLLHSSIELAKTVGQKEVIRELEKIRLRLSYGVKEELLPLLKLKNIGRVRARKLYSQGIKDIGDVKNIDNSTLSQILGRVIADDVKKQVGEGIKEIPVGTRKGQLSLEKF